MGSLVELRREGDVFILSMNHGDNRISKRLADELNAHLDTVERAEGAVALVTTGNGKYYSNGLDVQTTAQQSIEEQEANSRAIFKTMARLLTLPVPTVCAINGHAFGAGFYLALCHDYRIMRNDAGWLCIPAITLGLDLPPGLFELAKAKIPPPALRDVLLRGKWLNSKDAERAGIIDASVPSSELLTIAVKTAAQVLAEDRKRATTAKVHTIAPRKDLVHSFKIKLYTTAYRLLSEGDQAIDVSKHSLVPARDTAKL